MREANEVAEDGTIEEAVNILLGQLIRRARQSGLDDLKGKTVCTYCNGGYMGNIGADELNKKGFTSVTIDDGYAAWKEERKGKEKGKKRERKGKEKGKKRGAQIGVS